jgi:hypothetical protein
VLGTVLMDAGGSGLLDVVSTVLLVGGVLVVLAAGAVGIMFAVAVRRVRRSGVLTTASLRLHTITGSGPHREVARLRLELHRAVDGGNAAIVAGTAGTGLPGEAPALLRRIQREATTLDAHLRVMQAEDDRETLRAALPALRRRVAEIAGLVRHLRAAIADGLAAVSGSAMAELDAEVQREVIALRAGRERLRHLDQQTSRPGWTDEGASR